MIRREDLDAIRTRWLAKKTEASDVAAVLFLFDELEERLEHVTRERDEARASVADASRRGAEAMRDACTEACWSVPPDAHPSDCAFAVNALPIPEEQ